MKVFISYSTMPDQIVALRLQTLAAVYGISAYVPPAITRQIVAPQLPEDVRGKLQESDVVLVVMMHDPVTSAIAQEMHWALATGKLLIPIVSPLVSPEYYAAFVPHFVLNPGDPSQTEAAIVQFLTQKQQASETRTALLALATIAVGLLLFSSDAKRD